MPRVNKKRDPVVEDAISRAGGVTKLARAMTRLGQPISKVAISRWTKVPEERVAVVAQITGLSRKWLRPDLYE